MDAEARNHGAARALEWIQIIAADAISYRALLQQHLLPFWGQRWLAEITPGEVQGFLVQKSQSGLSWHSIRYIRNLLSQILRTAVDWGNMDEMRMNRVKLATKPLADPPTILSLDQIRKLLDALEEPFRAMVTVAILSALRRGELFALRWRCVDLAQRFLTVRESV